MSTSFSLMGEISTLELLYLFALPFSKQSITMIFKTLSLPPPFLSSFAALLLLFLLFFQLMVSFSSSQQLVSQLL